LCCTQIQDLIPVEFFFLSAEEICVILCMIFPKTNASELPPSTKQKPTESTHSPACEQPNNNKLNFACDGAKRLIRKIFSETSLKLTTQSCFH